MLTYKRTCIDTRSSDSSTYEMEICHANPRKALEVFEEIAPNILDTRWHGIFLNLNWLTTWLKTIPENTSLIIVTATLNAEENPWHGKCCALGIFGIHNKEAWLHRTGVSELDQIWIEYNQLLSHPLLPNHVQPAMMQFILDAVDVDVIHISMSNFGANESIMLRRCDRFSWLDVSHQERGWFIPLREVPVDIHWSCSVRRGMKDTEKYAKTHKWRIELCSPDSAWHALMETSHWHIDKWAGTNTESGFKNPEFVKFHQQYIQTENAKLFLVFEDDACIGSVYTICDRKALGFYLGCYKAGMPARVKIGIWAHIEISRWAEHNGFDEYDFMGGEARYKAGITPHTREFIAVSLYKRTFKNGISLFARGIYAKLKQIVSGPNKR